MGNGEGRHRLASRRRGDERGPTVRHGQHAVRAGQAAGATRRREPFARIGIGSGSGIGGEDEDERPERGRLPTKVLGERARREGADEQVRPAGVHVRARRQHRAGVRVQRGVLLHV